MNEQVRAQAQQLAQEFIQRGDASGWFEQLYTQAQGNEQVIYSSFPLAMLFGVLIGVIFIQWKGQHGSRQPS